MFEENKGRITRNERIVCLFLDFKSIVLEKRRSGRIKGNV
jgi:hypothetical protein